MNALIEIAAVAGFPCVVYLALDRLLPRVGPAWAAVLLRACVACGMGLGLASCFDFVGLLLLGPSRTAFRVGELLLLGSAAGWLIARRARRLSPARGAPTGGRLRWVVPVLCLLALLASATTFVLLTLERPHGAWDAWGIWNMRARYLLHAGEDWTDVFATASVMAHLDYPLLLPGIVARLWRATGGESVWIPASIALLFTYAGVGVVLATLALKGRTTQGFAAALCLVGVAPFVTRGSQQTADVPLGYFLLCAAALLLLGRRARSPLLLLFGLAVGLAGWTKNEGLLLPPVLLLTSLAVALPALGIRPYLRAAGWALLGFLPVAIVITLFKLRVAPANDVVAASRQAEMIAFLGDPSRYLQVLDAVGRRLGGWGGGILVALLAIAGFGRLALRRDGPKRERIACRLIGATLAMMLAGYVLIYVVTPKNLDWHLKTSLDRLLLHLWPSGVLLLFLLFGDPWREERPEPLSAGAGQE